MTVQMNTISPTTFTTSVLIGDETNSGGNPPVMTISGNAPVSAALEIQSTLGSLLLPRLSDAEAAALNSCDGMFIFNSTTGYLQLFRGLNWLTVASFDASSNLYIGTAAATTDGNSVIVLPNNDPPDTDVPDAIQIYSDDLSAGNTTFCFFTEGTPISATSITAADHSLGIKVNGVIYYIPCKLTNN